MQNQASSANHRSTPSGIEEASNLVKLLSGPLPTQPEIFQKMRQIPLACWDTKFEQGCETAIFSINALINSSNWKLEIELSKSICFANAAEPELRFIGSIRRSSAIPPLENEPGQIEDSNWFSINLDQRPLLVSELMQNLGPLIAEPQTLEAQFIKVSEQARTYAANDRWALAILKRLSPQSGDWKAFDSEEAPDLFDLECDQLKPSGEITAVDDEDSLDAFTLDTKDLAIKLFSGGVYQTDEHDNEYPFRLAILIINELSTGRNHKLTFSSDFDPINFKVVSDLIEQLDEQV